MGTTRSLSRSWPLRSSKRKCASIASSRSVPTGTRKRTTCTSSSTDWAYRRCVSSWAHSSPSPSSRSKTATWSGRRSRWWPLGARSAWCELAEDTPTLRTTTITTRRNSVCLCTRAWTRKIKRSSRPWWTCWSRMVRRRRFSKPTRSPTTRAGRRPTTYSFFSATSWKRRQTILRGSHRRSLRSRARSRAPPWSRHRGPSARSTKICRPYAADSYSEKCELVSHPETR